MTKFKVKAQKYEDLIKNIIWTVHRKDITPKEKIDDIRKDVDDYAHEEADNV